jgi:hypothetical protein
MASTVAGFLDPDDIKKLMKTCKQIHSDKQVKKICTDKLTEQYTMRLYPVDGAQYQIMTPDGLRVPRTFRIYTRFGYRSANLCLGAPDFDQVDAALFHVYYQYSGFSFYTSERPFMENGRVSEVPVRSLVDDTFLSTVAGFSIREIDIDRAWNVMDAVLVVHRNPTLTLRVRSRFSAMFDDRVY